jgi:hypothetical protein
MQIAKDPRYTALPERRCRQLFNQFHSTLKDQQPVANPTPVSESAAAPSSSSPPPRSPSSPTPATSWSSSSPAESQPLSASRLAESSTSEQEEDQQQHWEDPGPGQGLAELTQQAGAQMPTAGDMTNGKASGGVQSAGQLDALEALRQDQARLKAEYDRMEVSNLAVQMAVLAWYLFWVKTQTVMLDNHEWHAACHSVWGQYNMAEAAQEAWAKLWGTLCFSLLNCLAASSLLFFGWLEV